VVEDPAMARQQLSRRRLLLVAAVIVALAAAIAGARADAGGLSSSRLAGSRDCSSNGTVSFSVAPGSLTFGAEQVGQTAAPLGLTITNTSPEDTCTNTTPQVGVGASIGAASDGENDFSLANSPSRSSLPSCDRILLSGGQSCEYWVFFRPSLVGTITATMTLAIGLGVDQQTVALSGSLVGKPRVKTKVGKLVLAYDERIATEKGDLRDAVHDADVSKQSVTALLAEQRQRLVKALGQQQSVEEDTASVQWDLDAVKRRLDEITAAETAIPPALQPLAAKRDKLSGEVDRLNGLILAGQEGLLPQLDSTQNRLTQVENQLASRLPDHSALGADKAALNAALDSLQAKNDALQRAQLRADTEAELAEKSVVRLIVRQQSLDSELADDAQKLAALDFSLTDVEVEADGRVIYDARVNTPYDELDTLNEELATGKQTLSQLDTRREEAVSRVIAADDATMRTRERLAATIISVSHEKAAVDFAVNAYDVIKAGFNGGLIGAAAETMKKAIEAVMFPSGTLDPATVEGNFNARFEAGLQNEVSFTKEAGIVGSRAVKDTVLKAGKDRLNQRYGPLVFEKMYGAIPAIYTTSDAKVAEVSQHTVLRFVTKRFQDQENTAILNGFERLDNVRKGIVFDSKALRASGIGLLKDVSKGLLKAQIDTIEEAAWYDYFAADAYQRATFAMWQLISDDYWTGYDVYQQLLAQKQTLLLGYDPSTGIRTIVDAPFSTAANATVVLEVGQPKGAPPVGLSVEIDGKTARTTGRFRYVLAAGALAKSSDTVVVTIR
jgi:hypothetical protein